LKFSPDGRHLVAWDGTGRTVLFSLEERRGRELTDSFGEVAMDQLVRFSPDGRWLAGFTSSWHLNLWSLHDATHYELDSLWCQDITDMAFLDGQTLLVAGDCEYEPDDQAEVTVLTVGPRHVVALPDSARIVFDQEGVLKVRGVTGGIHYPPGPDAPSEPAELLRWFSRKI
jgi:hypothetical protein